METAQLIRHPARACPSSTRRRGALVVITEDHYFRTPEGVYTNLVLDYSYWRQYLHVFDEVRPLARVHRAERADPAWKRCDGPGVQFADVPAFKGLRSLLANAYRVYRIIAAHLRRGDYYAMRGSGFLTTMAWCWLVLRHYPYARQIGGHDLEGITLSARMRSAFVERTVARLAFWLSRRMVRGACCSACVSQRLREAYPAGRNAPGWLFSDVNLAADVLVGPRTAERFSAEALRIVSVGRLNPEKGYSVLLEALRLLDDAGERRWSAEIIGDGTDLAALRERATALGFGDRVDFPGWVPQGPDLLARLERADLFVLPSLTEGTPRALLEAMANGLPALASDVGGVPELLSQNALLPPGDTRALADRLRRLIGDRQALAAMSADCFGRALRFHPDRMLAAKREYWGFLRSSTDHWRQVTKRR